eukprot:TRINITY_DN915_c0_g1_i1.p1 TRINITY_DN915_c0_g1~~TRINITY_DN915_c0_g1_i1.p1  ORF type:complete len:1519 (-),score=80.60 TRINITY_DN915_c0_g1_i1:440-4996(-)
MSYLQPGSILLGCPTHSAPILRVLLGIHRLLRPCSRMNSTSNLRQRSVTLAPPRRSVRSQSLVTRPASLQRASDPGLSEDVQTTHASPAPILLRSRTRYSATQKPKTTASSDPDCRPPTRHNLAPELPEPSACPPDPVAPASTAPAVPLAKPQASPPRTPPNPISAHSTPEKRVCQYCGQSFKRRGLPSHQRSCKHRFAGSPTTQPSGSPGPSSQPCPPSTTASTSPAIPLAPKSAVCIHCGQSFHQKGIATHQRACQRRSAPLSASPASPTQGSSTSSRPSSPAAPSPDELCPKCGDTFHPRGLSTHIKSCNGTQKAAPLQISELFTRIADSQHLRCNYCSASVKPKGTGQHIQAHVRKGHIKLPTSAPSVRHATTASQAPDPAGSPPSGHPRSSNTDPASSNHSVGAEYQPRVHSTQQPLDQQEFGYVQVRDRLRLPPAKSKLWKEVDKHFAVLPMPKPDCDLNAYQEELDAQSWSILATNFGTLKPTPGTRPTTAAPPGDGKVQREIHRLKQTASRLWKDRHRWAASGDPQKFAKVIRLDQQLKRLQAKLAQKRQASDDQRDFLRDPHRYAATIFRPRSNKEPTFDKATADEFFQRTYRDEHRDQAYLTPPPGLQRPPPPTHAFNLACPSDEEIQRVIWKKPNRSSPGINGIPYVVYKRCKHLRQRLAAVICAAWSSWTALRSWQLAKVTLIAKSDVLDLPKEFRPIALLNATGKIFFSIGNLRLEKYMISNNYLRVGIQKAFRTGMPGCVENIAQLSDALNTAKDHQRPICASFIDLENAYGTVRHNLIQWALWWYHVPERFADLVFSYYNHQAAIVATTQWTTNWFQYGIGTMQGCCFAGMLFNVSFNPVLEVFDLPKHQQLGFRPAPDAEPMPNKVYADDLTIITAEPSENQLLIDAFEEALAWTGSMRAKPTKCRSLAMRVFGKNYDGPYKQVQHLVHSSYDPLLTVRGQPVQFIGHDGQPFKFLGRLISFDLQDDFARRRITDTLDGLLELVNKRPLRGWQKMWLYNYYVAPKLCWMLMIYELPLTFVEQLESTCTRFLKRWLGLAKCAVTDILYVDRQHHGFQLHALATFYRRLQLVRLHLLKHSPDPEVQKLFVRLSQAPRDKRLKWNPFDALEMHETTLLNERALNEQQRSRSGLGFRLTASDHSPLDSLTGMRDAISKREQTESIRERLDRLRTLEMQGSWSLWDTACQQDLSWRALFTGAISDSVLKFAINAQLWTLPSEDNKRRWGMKAVGKSCQLLFPSSTTDSTTPGATPLQLSLPCGQLNPTGKHVLTSCKAALAQGRYTWRHNSVLNAVEQHLSAQLELINKGEVSLNKHRRLQFVQEGGQPYNIGRDLPQPAPVSLADHLALAHDWRLLVDLPGHANSYIAIPPQIASASDRPDILLVSDAQQIAIILELTCPIEERFDVAHDLKHEKYQHLVADAAAQQWTLHVCCFEIGARGVIGTSTRDMLRCFGFNRQRQQQIQQTLSDIARRCSYWLFLSRFVPTWEDRGLLAFSPHLLRSPNE